MPIPAAPNATHSLRGARIGHRPHAAANASQGTAKMAATTSRAPPAFARNAPDNCPRAAYAHAVVIPQDGHGRLKRMRKVQGPKPMRSCVP